MFLHCGLRIRSELDLHLPVTAESRADVDVRCGDPIDDSVDRPDGIVIAEYWEGDRRLYTATCHEAGYTVRFPECGEFVISCDHATVEVRRDRAGLYAELLPVLMAGTVVALLHGLRGSTMLHASAVAIDNHALAFVGSSGQGKSTLAGLFCAAGAPLVTDDVLLVSAEPRPMCVGGASEIRLRASAAPIAEQSQEFAARTTVDDRTAMSPRHLITHEVPLGAVVVPMPSRSASTVEIVEVPPVQRLVTLLHFPRIAGWVDREVLVRQFETLARVAESVPVFHATIPWGPPFGDSITADLSDLVMQRAAGA